LVLYQQFQKAAQALVREDDKHAVIYTTGLKTIVVERGWDRDKIIAGQEAELMDTQVTWIGVRKEDCLSTFQETVVEILNEQLNPRLVTGRCERYAPHITLRVNPGTSPLVPDDGDGIFTTKDNNPTPVRVAITETGPIGQVTKVLRPTFG